MKQAQKYIVVKIVAEKDKREVQKSKEHQERKGTADREAQEAREDRRRKRKGITQVVRVGKEILVAQEGGMTGRKIVKGEIVEIAVGRAKKRAKTQKVE